MFSMSRALQRLAVGCKRVLPPSLAPCTQHRGLRSKKEIRLDKNKASFNWAKRLEEENLKKAEAVEAKPEPSEIHIVYQTTTVTGRPYWEKEIMAKLGFDRKVKRVLVKNTPYFNDMLREVKHLVRMMPLKFPHGVPTNSTDFERSYINSLGEVVVQHTLHPTEEAIAPREEPSKWDMQAKTFKKELQRKLELNEVHSEYYQEEHEYKLNQDGKEHRYNYNKDLPKHKSTY